MKELGIRYIADYYHDDQPTLVRTKHGPLPCVPYSMEINDAQVYRWQTEGAEFARMIRDAFDTLYEEGAETGRVLAICLHPFLYGQPHRLKYLDEALAYVMSHEGVWQATGSEITDWANARMAAFLGPAGGGGMSEQDAPLPRRPRLRPPLVRLAAAGGPARLARRRPACGDAAHPCRAFRARP